MVARRIEPRVPLGTAVAASFGLDLLWPILLLLGLETVAVHPGDTKFTNLEFVSYPWSHSLLMAAVWSITAAAAVRRALGAARPAIVVGLLVLSHWVLDFVTHRPDLPLWPGGPLAGLGMWNSIADTLFVEGVLLAFGIWHYRRARPRADGVGRWALVGLLVLTTVIWASQPWLPPPPSATAVAWGGLALWLLPLWGRWVDTHRSAAAVLVAMLVSVPAGVGHAQGGGPPDVPAVTVRGQVYTPRSILARNMGDQHDLRAQRAHHRAVGGAEARGARRGLPTVNRLFWRVHAAAPRRQRGRDKMPAWARLVSTSSISSKTFGTRTPVRSRSRFSRRSLPTRSTRARRVSAC
jgi:hypothetical protein